MTARLAGISCARVASRFVQSRPVEPRTVGRRARPVATRAGRTEAPARRDDDRAARPAAAAHEASLLLEPSSCRRRPSLVTQSRHFQTPAAALRDEPRCTVERRPAPPRAHRLRRHAGEVRALAADEPALDRDLIVNRRRAPTKCSPVGPRRGRRPIGGGGARRVIVLQKPGGRLPGGSLQVVRLEEPGRDGGRRGLVDRDRLVHRDHRLDASASPRRR